MERQTVPQCPIHEPDQQPSLPLAIQEVFPGHYRQISKFQKCSLEWRKPGLDLQETHRCDGLLHTSWKIQFRSTARWLRVRRLRFGLVNACWLLRTLVVGRSQSNGAQDPQRLGCGSYASITRFEMVEDNPSVEALPQRARISCVPGNSS